MGVYIADLTLPKKVVDIYMTMFTRDEPSMAGTIPMELVSEIDLVRCGECKWFGVDDGMPFCYWWLREIEPDVFCSYGERRADGNKRRSV